MYSVFMQGKQRYCLRQLHCSDFPRQREYQRLRAKIFVDQFGWQIPVDRAGCERDRYDELDENRVRISCVYGKRSWRGTECLLGGVRTLILRSWDDSMTTNEFHLAGMIPLNVIQSLKARYQENTILEITRLCLQRGRIYDPQWTGYSPTQFHMGIARDLVYASVYELAEQTGRYLALGIADRYYLRVMRHSHFAFEELYTQIDGARGGYSLTMIDLSATIKAMMQSGAYDRVRRMLVLCSQSNNLLSRSA